MTLKNFAIIKALIDRDLDIHFKKSIPPFNDIFHFKLSSNEEMAPFVNLSCQDRDDVHFLCIDPALIYPNFRKRIFRQDKQFLEIEDDDEALMLVCISQAEDARDYTANMMAPLLINASNGLAKQIVQDKFPVRYPIWDNLS